MTKEEAINTIIAGGCDTNKISDGYHTFEELYEHRIILFIALCRMIDGSMESTDGEVWKSKKHSDGTEWNGWFLLGINQDKGNQITYHLSEKYWDDCEFAVTLEQAPEFDGHTSQDVLKRLKEL